MELILMSNLSVLIFILSVANSVNTQFAEVAQTGVGGNNIAGRTYDDDSYDDDNNNNNNNSNSCYITICT
jgi:hypothetical protein